MTQSATPTPTAIKCRAAQLRDWAKTLATFLLVAPLPAFMLWAAFTMPGMP